MFFGTKNLKNSLKKNVSRYAFIHQKFIGTFCKVWYTSLENIYLKTFIQGKINKVLQETCIKDCNLSTQTWWNFFIPLNSSVEHSSHLLRFCHDGVEESLQRPSRLQLPIKPRLAVLQHAPITLILHCFHPLLAANHAHYPPCMCTYTLALNA